MQVSGYTVIPLKRKRGDGLFQSFLFVKPHIDKNNKDENRTLFVSNLSDELLDADVEGIFAVAGKVSSVSLGSVCDGRSSRFAHVTFKNSKSVTNALKLPLLFCDASSRVVGLEST
jgi:hypothetical protein